MNPDPATVEAMLASRANMVPGWSAAMTDPKRPIDFELFHDAVAADRLVAEARAEERAKWEQPVWTVRIPDRPCLDCLLARKAKDCTHPVPVFVPLDEWLAGDDPSALSPQEDE